MAPGVFAASLQSQPCRNWLPICANSCRSVQGSSVLQGTWLMMLETDYVFAKVPDLPTQAGSDGEVMPVAFPFHYIQPTAKHLEPIIREMYTEDLGPVTDIQPSGPAPVLIKVEQLTRVQAFARIASSPLQHCLLHALCSSPFPPSCFLHCGRPGDRDGALDEGQAPCVACLQPQLPSRHSQPPFRSAVCPRA